MKRILFFTLVVLTSVALAQGKPAPASKDGGVAPPVAAAKPDAGMPQLPGTAPVATLADLDKARKEIAELKSKVADLEARVTKTEGLSRELDSVKTKLEKLDKLEARLDAEDDRREAEEREVARKKSVAAQNSQMLSGALQSLSTGNTSNVDAWLRSAEQNTSGNTQKLVQLARQALSQQDLVTARQYLTLALMEPQ